MPNVKRLIGLLMLSLLSFASCLESSQTTSPEPPLPLPIAEIETEIVANPTIEQVKRIPTPKVEPTPEPVLNDVGIIKIGYMGPLTGGASFVGLEQLGFVKTIVDVFSEQTGLQIEIVEADTEINPEVGEAVAQRFAEDSEIVAVIGPAGSQVCEATQPIFEGAGLVHITPSCTKTDLTSPGTSTFFRPIPTDADQSRTLAAHMIVATKIRTLHIVTDQSSYASVLSDELSILLSDSGIRVRRFSIEQYGADYAAIAAAVVKMDSDAVFIVSQLEDQTGAIAIQLHQQNFNGYMYLPDSGFTSGWVESAGDAAEGTYVSFFSPDPNLVPEAAHYNELYTAKFGPDFGAFGGASGLAAQVLLKAVSQCAHDDNVSRECVADELRFTEMNNTLLGIPIKFGEGNQSDGVFSLFQIQNGNFELLDGVGDPGNISK